MATSVKNYVENCTICQERKVPAKYNKPGLTPIRVTGVFERMAMDVLGPLPTSLQ